MLNKHQYKIDMLVLRLISQQNETSNRSQFKQTVTMVAVIILIVSQYIYTTVIVAVQSFILNTTHQGTATSDAVKIHVIK